MYDKYEVEYDKLSLMQLQGHENSNNVAVVWHNIET